MAEKNETLEQVRERILSAENILVALSKDPTVDEMAGAIGLTMMLDRAGKHATAIYSGKTPNALQFLKPEETFEADTSSLQDFIIALNKEKADHLRYKVEGDYVRVYITPYKTEISEKDLEFSHGDFNVDLVIALNIDEVEHLDAALAEYGRIMHDATAVNITTGAAGKFAELEWSDQTKSSVSEMIVEMAAGMKDVKMGKEVATALLTGIVAATDRFSNDRTTPETMSVAAELMKAGADQKLIADNMELTGESAPVATREPGKEEIGDEEPTIEENREEKVKNDGGLAVDHEAENAMEQLRQVANDVELPEFKPGDNPAEVIAPEMQEKEANDIPEMNFGGGGTVLTPPSEAENTPETLGEMVDAPQPLAPAAEASVPETKEEPKAEEMPIMGLDDIQLPPPPAPPVDMGTNLPQAEEPTTPELPKMEEPELPSIEIKSEPTLVEEPKEAGMTESAEGMESEAGGESGAGSESSPEIKPEDNSEFKIPGA